VVFLKGPAMVCWAALQAMPEKAVVAGVNLHHHFHLHPIMHNLHQRQPIPERLRGSG
jgi:hypothetical protein